MSRLVKSNVLGQLNTPATIDATTSEIITLFNGSNARVVNTFYLLRGKFHAFSARGQTSSNDYQDLVFLITQYPMDMARYSSHIDEVYRRALLRRWAEMNAGNPSVVEWMRNTLGLLIETRMVQTGSD